MTGHQLGIRTKFFRLLLVLLVIVNIGCNKNKGDPEERPKDEITTDSLKILPEGSEYNLIIIDPSVKFQQIDNFGASDSWSVQFVGKWPDSKSNQMADWLFSMDTTNNGQPLGIGLSCWRFNIGAGSTGQGGGSGIADEWRRAECFLQANGTYNWNRQLGQQWFLEAAHERGVEQFIGFTNSPPVHLTKNGKAYGSPGDPENIALSKIPEFTQFLVEVQKGLKQQTGVELSLLSPVNEPQWNWISGSQEGCYMRNSTFREVVEELDMRLAGLETEILISEAGEWPYLFNSGDETGNQIEYFFGANSPVKDAPNLSKIIAGHSYYTTTPDSKLISIRQEVWNKTSTIPDLKVWSTEYCPLGNEDMEALGWSSWHKDLTMDVALYAAKIIYHDLVYTQVSAWQWWLAISPYDYPDGLIYVSKDKVNGTYTDSKLMWTFGNFSRFVRPGAFRLKTENESSELYAVAFSSDDEQNVIIVLINPTDKDQPVKLKIEGTNSGSVRPFITSNNEFHKLLPMVNVDLADAFKMPAKSVITFIMKK